MNNVKLPQKEHLILEDFINRLGGIYGDSLISVILYGSAASGEFAQKHSNINLVAILRNTDLAELARSYNLLNSRSSRAISCIFFTEDYVNRSTDTFPIEFLDMKENYAVLYGKDVLKDLIIDTKNLRFQCEHELKSKLIMIKRGYLTTRERKSLEELLFKSFTSCLHIMRNLLRLKGKEPPYAKEMIISALEKDFGVNTTVLSEILWAKNKGMRLNNKEIDSLLAGFVRELESIVEKVDRL